MSIWLCVDPEADQVLYLRCDQCLDKYLPSALKINTETLLKMIKSFSEVHQSCALQKVQK